MAWLPPSVVPASATRPRAAACGVMIAEGWRMLSGPGGNAFGVVLFTIGLLLGLLIDWSCKASARSGLLWLSSTAGGGLLALSHLRRISDNRSEDAQMMTRFVFSCLLGIALSQVSWHAKQGEQAPMICVLGIFLSEALSGLEVVSFIFLLLTGLSGLVPTSTSGTSGTAYPATGADANSSAHLSATVRAKAEVREGKRERPGKEYEPFFPATVVESQKYSPHFLVRCRAQCVRGKETTATPGLLELLPRQAEAGRDRKPGKAEAKRREKASARTPVPFEPQESRPKAGSDASRGDPAALPEAAPAALCAISKELEVSEAPEVVEEVAPEVSEEVEVPSAPVLDAPSVTPVVPTLNAAAAEFVLPEVLISAAPVEGEQPELMPHPVEVFEPMGFSGLEPPEAAAAGGFEPGFQAQDMLGHSSFEYGGYESQMYDMGYAGQEAFSSAFSSSNWAGYDGYGYMQDQAWNEGWNDASAPFAGDGVPLPEASQPSGFWESRAQHQQTEQDGRSTAAPLAELPDPGLGRASVARKNEKDQRQSHPGGKGNVEAAQPRKGSVSKGTTFGVKGTRDGRKGSGGDESQPDSQLWAYVDPRGKIQSGFTSAKMRGWFQSGFFKEHLEVAQLKPDGQVPPRRAFQALKQLFPQVDRCFL